MKKKQQQQQTFLAGTTTSTSRKRPIPTSSTNPAATLPPTIVLASPGKQGFEGIPHVIFTSKDMTASVSKLLPSQKKHIMMPYATNRLDPLDSTVVPEWNRGGG